MLNKISLVLSHKRGWIWGTCTVCSLLQWPIFNFHKWHTNFSKYCKQKLSWVGVKQLWHLYVHIIKWHAVRRFMLKRNSHCIITVITLAFYQSCKGLHGKAMCSIIRSMCLLYRPVDWQVPIRGFSFLSIFACTQQGQATLRKTATMHQLTTMLAISKNSNFQVITTCSQPGLMTWHFDYHPSTSKGDN